MLLFGMWVAPETEPPVTVKLPAVMVEGLTASSNTTPTSNVPAALRTAPADTMAGGKVSGTTVRTASALVAVAPGAARATEYLAPLSARVASGVLYVAEVAPAMSTPFFFHWKEAPTMPVTSAATEKVAERPSTAETEAGWLVMAMVALGTLTETALPLKAEAVPLSGVASVIRWNVAAKLSPPPPSCMMPSM